MLRVIVLRHVIPPTPTKGLGSIGPVKAFYGASAPNAPPLQLWTFVLPTQPPPAMLAGAERGERVGGSGGHGGVVMLPNGGNAAPSASSNFLEGYLSAPTAAAVWTTELPLCVSASAAVKVAGAVSQGAWLESANAESLRLAAAGASPEQLVRLLRSVRARWVARLREKRRSRCGAMLSLGEIERASGVLEARAKASLRRLHALVALSLVRNQVGPTPAIADGTLAGASGPASNAPLGRLMAEVIPSARPDGSCPMCYCHPPSMRVCRECTALRARIDDATQTVAQQLSADEPDDKNPTLQREASIRSLRTGSAWATQSVSSTGYEDAKILQSHALPASLTTPC